MKIIGISGHKGSGKTTVADIISTLLLPSSSVKIGFADPLKEEVAKMYGCSVSYVEEHKPNFRLILQGHGTDYRRKLCGDQYWIEKFLLKTLRPEYDKVDWILVPDVRFKNEMQCINNVGGTLVRIERPGLPHDSHTSENDLDDVIFQHTILNDGGLDKLKTQVQELLKKIK